MTENRGASYVSEIQRSKLEKGRLQEANSEHNRRQGLITTSIFVAEFLMLSYLMFFDVFLQ